jgi:uncharacterized protein
MHSDDDAQGRRPSGPALGVSFEGRPRALLEAAAPIVDVIEVVPDCLVGADAAVNPRALADLDELAPNAGVTYHGIGLSIGSTAGWNTDYLRTLDVLMNWREPRWHSEHLGFCVVDASFIGTMPALPATREVLDLVVERACDMRRRYGLEFMLEHVATPLARPADISLAAFLNTLARECGSRLLLDLHNLECDADNGLLDLPEFLDELDWSLVGEIHVAGGVWAGGYHLDVHSGPVAASTQALLDLALKRAVNLDLVVYELLAAAVPVLGAGTVTAQLTSIRDQLDAGALEGAL